MFVCVCVCVCVLGEGEGEKGGVVVEPPPNSKWLGINAIHCLWPPFLDF